MSLLTVIQKAATGLGLTRPSSAFANPEPTVAQLLSLFEEFGMAAARNYSWGRLEVPKSWVAPGTESQGSLSELFGSPTALPLLDTVYSTSLQQQVFPFEGNVGSQQTRVAQVAGTFFQWEIRAGNLLIFPAPPIGTIFTCVIRDNAWVVNSLGQQTMVISADTDTFVVPEDLLVLGLRAYWRLNKNLPFQSLQSLFDAQASIAVSQQRPGTIINMGQETPEARPRIGIPLGNFNQ